MIDEEIFNEDDLNSTLGPDPFERIAKAIEALAENRTRDYPGDNKDYTRNDALSFAIDHHKGSSKDDATVLKTANAFYNFLTSLKENK